MGMENNCDDTAPNASYMHSTVFLNDVSNTTYIQMCNSREWYSSVGSNGNCSPNSEVRNMKGNSVWELSEEQHNKTHYEQFLEQIASQI